MSDRFRLVAFFIPLGIPLQIEIIAVRIMIVNIKRHDEQ